MSYDVPIFKRIHIFFLLDRSGSMTGSRIETLNKAMANVLNALDRFSRMQAKQVCVHILSFADDVQWLCGTTAEVGVSVRDIQWTDITPGGPTDTAAAIRAIIPGISPDWLRTTYRPVIVLVTDGWSNDTHDMLEAVKELITCKKTIRVGIGVEDYDAAELKAFASLANYRWEDELGNQFEAKLRPMIHSIDRITDLMALVENIAVAALQSSIRISDCYCVDDADPYVPTIYLPEESSDSPSDW